MARSAPVTRFGSAERSTLAARLGPALKSASAEMPCLTERSGPALMYHLSFEFILHRLS